MSFMSEIKQKIESARSRVGDALNKVVQSTSEVVAPPAAPEPEPAKPKVIVVVGKRANSSPKA